LDKDRLIRACDGDGRTLLNMLEVLADFDDGTSDSGELLDEVLKTQVRRFDQHGDIFYDQISALHKSVRGSDPDAALYWLARMLDGGCDIAYLARRIVRIAHEDIGLADPRASALALEAWKNYERLGSPEGELALANALVYLSCCAKSNAGYLAFKKAQSCVSQYGSAAVPLHLRNATTKLNRELGYAKGYRYAHDEQDGFAPGAQYWPENMPSQQFYQPVDRGLEIKISQKLAVLREKNKENAGK
jgi:putative ATPase